MKAIKENLSAILLVFSVILFGIVITSNKHDRQLLEVARVHQFIGCMQVSNRNIPLCAKIVAITPQAKLIEEILDSKMDDGKMVIDQSKMLEPTMEQNNGNFN